MPLDVLIVDDHPMFRWGVRQYISTLSDFALAGEATNGFEALAFLEKSSVDVVILDIDMPELDGIAFLEALNARSVAKPRIVVLSQMSGDSHCRRLQAAGIDAYVLKTEGIGEIANALKALNQGETYFSPGMARRFWELLQNRPEQRGMRISDRELTVARLISQGLSTPTIAQKLGCAPSTIKTHRANLMQKIGAKNTADVTRWVASTIE